MPIGSRGVAVKEKAHGEEWDYVAGCCKLNYLNVLTVIISKKREERDSREGKISRLGVNV